MVKEGVLHVVEECPLRGGGECSRCGVGECPLHGGGECPPRGVLHVV